jgi:hypothetical protein
MFFESSTRTQASFEIAGKRLGADVMSMAMQASSIKKGETLIDTALTLNAMRPDILVVRHPQSGAVDLLAQKVDCTVLNAGDGRHEHPTQALLDALTIRREKGRLHRLTVAICGDIAHSRVGPLQHHALGQDGEPDPPDRPAHPDARRDRRLWLRGLRQHGRGPQGRRRGDDAAAPEGADGRRPSSRPSANTTTATA